MINEIIDMALPAIRFARTHPCRSMAAQIYVAMEATARQLSIPFPQSRQGAVHHLRAVFQMIETISINIGDVQMKE